MKLNKVQAFNLVVDGLVSTGLVNEVHYTHNYDSTKPSEKELRPYIPTLHKELNSMGPKNAYMRCHIPLMFITDERVVTKEHYSMGCSYGEFTLTERTFFEGCVVVDIHQDCSKPERGFVVKYSVDTHISWSSLQECQTYTGHFNRLLEIFQMVDQLLSDVTIEEDESDFAWVTDRVKKRNTPTDVEDLEEFGNLVMESVNNYYPEDKDVKGLQIFLKGRGGKKKQLKEFGNLLHRLGDNKSEMAGSPDRNVAERFSENVEEFENLLVGILGREDFDTCDMYF